MASTIESLEGKSHLDLLKLGTRAYCLRQYGNAVTYLAKSSELLVEEHKDDKHESLGIVYLYYGKSLLELARESGDPLGDGVPKEVAREPTEEDDEGSDVSLDANIEAAENSSDVEDSDSKENGSDDEANDTKENGQTNGLKPEDGEAANDSKVEEGDTPAENSKIEDEAEDEEELEGEAAEKSPEEEEPSDLQLAWEVLELAKIILEKKGQEFIKDYADCLVSLGEISLESENFESAIADITSGLNIQKEIWKESEDFRKLAETYYKLGMALSAHNQVEEGIKNYETCMNLVKDRLKVLEEQSDLGESDKKEIKDIKNLIPDLEEKIADLRTFKDESRKPAVEEEEKPMVSSPEKKANNISHLVKRKRKLEEITDEVAASAAKKAAPSPSSDKKEEPATDSAETSKNGN